MRTGFLRILAGFLTGWLLPPLAIAFIVGVMMGVNAPQPNEGLADQVIKSLFYGVLVGLPASFAVMVVVVSPTWFFLHRSQAGDRAFLFAGAVIGGLLGLVPLAGTALSGNPGGLTAGLLTVAVPAAIGALTFLLIRRIAYRTGG